LDGFADGAWSTICKDTLLSVIHDEIQADQISEILECLPELLNFSRLWRDSPVKPIWFQRE
jgi:hypothetical protein